jgi:hypothetical protein
MTAEQIRALGPAFAAHLRPFEPCFVDCSTVEHQHTYCRGLLSDLPRKSVEPIALAAGALEHTVEVIVYHQQRNWASRRSRQRSSPLRE